MRTLLVTPSYGPDLKRCQLLVQSANRYVSGIDRHLIIIDEAERYLFQPLESERVQLVSKESMLPWWIRRNPLSSRWWLSLSSLPVRGWIMQQVIKLAVAEHYQADLLLFADSDMVFIKPFTPEHIITDGKVRHYRSERKPVMYSDRRYRNWYAQAAGVCGIADANTIGGAYISQLNSWRHENIVELYRLIEAQGSQGWMTQLLRCLDMSEFVLYGTYVDHVLGPLSGHYVDEQEICHSSWYYQINSQQDVCSFVDQLSPQHRALHLQSNLGLAPDLLSAFSLSA